MLRHVAAIALVGWYLLTPAIRDNRVLTDAPLSWWTVSDSFDTAAACEAKRLSFATDPVGKVVRLNLPNGFDYKGKRSQALLTTAIQSAVCISTDDPRLKAK